MRIERSESAGVEEAVEELRAGRVVLVVDDEDHEHEGALVLAAELATAEAVNFMATHARGLICLSLTGEGCERLGLEPMTDRDEPAPQTQFTVTIDAREGITTGISAGDRAHTIRVAVDPASDAGAIVKGGHISPLRTEAGGVLERAGHPETSVDLARLAGLQPAGVICRIMSADGTMARGPELAEYRREHGLKMIAIAELVEYRRTRDKTVERLVATALPTAFGAFEAVGYRSLTDDRQHVALVKGEVAGRAEVLVRIHSECLTGDVFHSHRCDCGEQLKAAMEAIELEGSGVVLYLAREGRGLDSAPTNHRLGLPSDPGDYAIGAQMLADLGLSSIRLLTNDPEKIDGLDGHGLRVTGQIPIVPVPCPRTAAYLATKVERMDRLMQLAGPAAA